MAVLVEAISVLVTHSALQERFPGGQAAYQQTCPNSSYCSDGKICRVSFMVFEDAVRYTNALAKHGFAEPWSNGSREIAVVDESEGFLTPCDWLRIDLRTFLDDQGRVFGATIAGLPDEEPVTFSAPAQWRPRRFERVTKEDLEQNYEVLRVDRTPDNGGTVVAYRHRETGGVIYVGRPALPAESDIEARYLALVDELRSLKAQPVSRTRDDRVASFYDQVTELVESSNYKEPGPLLLRGIAARLSRRWNLAEQSFRKVTELRPDYLSGWLELTWALAKLERVDEAEAAARRAIEVDGASAAAYGNLANVLVVRGDDAGALAAITRAIELDPSVATNQRLLQTLREALPQASAEARADMPWYKRLFH